MHQLGRCISKKTVWSNEQFFCDYSFFNIFVSPSIDILHWYWNVTLYISCSYPVIYLLFVFSNMAALEAQWFQACEYNRPPPGIELLYPHSLFQAFRWWGASSVVRGVTIHRALVNSDQEPGVPEPEMTPVRTVTCVILRIINGAGRVSEFVYFSCSIFYCCR